MQTCTFVDFIQVLKPWLDSYHIRKGYLDKNGNFRLFFTDGGQKVYHIDDCSEARLMEVFEMLINRGIPVEKSE
jgi:hypothetical protein